MPKDDQGKRPPPVSYRPPEALREEFHRRVAASGLSASAFITGCVFTQEPPRQSRRPTVNHKEAARVLAGLGQVAQALRLAAQAADQARTHSLIDGATRDLAELRAVVFAALGREP